MLTIYHLETSRSERIVWLMEELGLPYRMQVFPRETTGAAPHPLKEIHALGRAPAIRDGDAVLAESGAIVDYIVHRHAGGRLALSPDDPGYARYVYWLHFADTFEDVAELLGGEVFEGWSPVQVYDLDTGEAIDLQPLHRACAGRPIARSQESGVRSQESGVRGQESGVSTRCSDS